MSYLVEHPDAEDTIDGILGWWKPSSSEEWRREQVQKTLDGLVSKKWVTRRRTTHSEHIYGLNKDQLEGIKHFLIHS